MINSKIRTLKEHYTNLKVFFKVSHYYKSLNFVLLVFIKKKILFLY